MSSMKLHRSLFLTLLLFISCSQQLPTSETQSIQPKELMASGLESAKDYDSAFNQCDAYVSNDGQDSNDGSLPKPYKTPNKAISLYKQGGVICLMPGIYSNISIVEVAATKKKPLVVRKSPQSNKDVLITSPSYTYETGVHVLRSSHVYVIGMNVSGFQKGISFDSVKGGGIIDNTISKIGLAGLHARWTKFQLQHADV